MPSQSSSGNSASPIRCLPLRRSLRGVVRVPGDKSISHRAVLFGAVNDGPLTITGFLRAADTMATVEAVRALGVWVEESGDALRVQGVGWEGLQEPADVIDVGNSGTLLRLLPGLVASRDFFCVLTGDTSIRRRPLARIVEPLAAMGVTVWARERGTLAPVALRGGPLRPLRHELKVASAQVKSCLMLAGLRAEGPSTLIEPAPSRDHTERMIRYAGGRVEEETLADGKKALTVWPAARLHMEAVTVPGDFSSAAFFVVAALLIPDSELTVENVGLNPSRTALLNVLQRMGADLEVVPGHLAGPEPVGKITARFSALQATDVGPDEVPNLIDELPVFMLAAAHAAGTSTVRGAADLRAKESDRLAVMAAALSSMGVRVKERPDGIDIEGCPQGWREGQVATQGDHRMAMLGAVAGLVSDRGVVVDNTECIAVSYPDFLAALRGLGAEWVELAL